MKTFITCLVASVISITPALANPKLEEAILKEITKKTKVTARELKDPNVAKCFSAGIYKVEIEQDAGPGTQTRNSLYMMKGDGIMEIKEPGTNAEMPELHGIVNPDFRLKTKEDGEHLIKAMRALFGYSFEEDEVETHFVQNGTTWVLITGTFFKNFSGYTFETNVDGKITKISRSLGIKK